MPYIPSMKKFPSNTIDEMVPSPSATNERFFYRFIAPLLVAVAIVYSFGNLTLVLALQPPLMMPLEKLPSPHYGPFQQKVPFKNRYHFESIEEGMGHFPLWRIEEISKTNFHEMLLKNVPQQLQEKIRKYLPLGLKTAEKYQIDPFWVMAVMWVESHFNPNAKSHVDATGLMQILPGTGHFIHQLMGKPISPYLSYLFVKDPTYNVDMGAFYLKRLLNRFDNNYTLATVAYNMGPTTVQNRLRYRLPVGVNNLYLNKVRQAYFTLSRSYRLYLVNTRPVYTKTYASSPSRRHLKKYPRNLFWFIEGAPKPTSLALDDHHYKPSFY